MSEFHAIWGWVAVVINGIVGCWGLLSYRRESPPTSFHRAIGVAISSLLLEVVLGVVLMTSRDLEPGGQHVFYGILIAVTFTFAYIYRAQFRKRPTLYYGLLLLFTMGLGLRGITTFGVDF